MLTNVYQRIDYICELEAFQAAKEKSDKIKRDIAKQNNAYDTGEDELHPHELLIDYPDSPLHERMRWKIICQQLSDGGYNNFKALYYDTDIIEIFEYMAVKNAIYACAD